MCFFYRFTGFARKIFVVDGMDIRAGIIQQVIDAIRSRVDEEAAVLVQDVLVMQLPAPNLLVRRMNRQDAAAVLRISKTPEIPRSQIRLK